MKCELYNDSMQGWKDVVGYEGLYQVNTDGEVRSVSHYTRNNTNNGQRYTKGRVLSAYQMPNGYLQVQLSKGDKREKHYVHRLVAITFLENKNGLPEVNHIDGNKRNNRIDNLEWVSHKENQAHMVKNGLTKKAFRLKNLENNHVYSSLCEAERETGMDRHKIKEMCAKNMGWVRV